MAGPRRGAPGAAGTHVSAALLLPLLGFASLATSFVSGILGMAGGMILLGILLAVLPLSTAMTLHGITQFAANGGRAFMLRREVDWRIAGGYAEFFNGRQAAVRRGNSSAGGLAAPEREKIQSREGEVFSPPGDVNADDIDLSAGEFGKTGNGIEKMFEAADVTRSSVVLPSVNVNEEQRTLCFMDNFESRFSLRIIQG